MTRDAVWKEIGRLEDDNAALRLLLSEARGSLAYAFGDQCDEFNKDCEGCQAWRLIKRIDTALCTDLRINAEPQTTVDGGK